MRRRTHHPLRKVSSCANSPPFCHTHTEIEKKRERRELLFYFGFSFADATWLTCHNWRTNPGSLMPHKYEYNSRMPRTCHKRVASTSGKVSAGILFAVDIATLFNYEINIMPTKPLKGATVASLTLPIPYLTPLLPFPTTCPSCCPVNLPQLPLVSVSCLAACVRKS